MTYDLSRPHDPDVPPPTVLRQCGRHENEVSVGCQVTVVYCNYDKLIIVNTSVINCCFAKGLESCNLELVHCVIRLCSAESIQPISNRECTVN